MCHDKNAFVGLIDIKKYFKLLIIRIGRKKIITAISKNVFHVKHAIKGKKLFYSLYKALNIKLKLLKNTQTIIKFT